ncbi:hypothetical protein HIM_10192 [Hirsutella minnesotensis 3608]|uniref:Ketoreductase domain-containing protein n=1 Tax=Hirsutella minnesotensis 3608 TaxID=1043627 RepID=A0A0F8A2J2_9HYPO|nr:hypothetical protein HIM_10192 [Hirsutella minnesotensis 3608]
MAFAARHALRHVRAASALRMAPRAALGASRLFSATRGSRLSETSPNLLSETVEVPMSTFEAGTTRRETIPIDSLDENDKVTLEESLGPIQPLSRSVHQAMPKTLRDMSILGKTVLITGGARGLGHQMARACAEAGAKTIIIFDNQQQLGDLAAEDLHEKSGVAVAFCKVDVRDDRAIRGAVNNVIERYGAPDVLINAAGIADSNLKAEEYCPNKFRRLIDINLNGSFHMAQAVGRAMMAAKKPGSIILVASMSGSIVNFPQEQSCYNASKAGVIQFAKSIAAEWAKYDIRVNCISPGYMDTALNRTPDLEAQKKIWCSMTPQSRLGGVDELNGLCVFLASDASKFMTGSNVLIDGGYSCY